MFDEKKTTYINNQNSETIEDNVDVIPGGSSSVYSGSVSQEVDVVDIYKKKIQMNINLKQKNLKVIQLLFVFSLVCYIVFGATIDFSFTSLGNFTFRDTYMTGIINFQSLVSKLVSVAFISHFNHMFVYNNSTLINSDPKLALLNSTYVFQDSIRNSFSEMSDSVDRFIKLDPQSYLSQTNAIKSYLYDWRDWSVDTDRTNNMTFFNYIKSLSVTLTPNTFISYQKFRESVLFLNIERLISGVYQLEANIRQEFDDSYGYMEGFLFYFILCG
jgi:hypothetical protein